MNVFDNQTLSGSSSGLFSGARDTLFPEEVFGLLNGVVAFCQSLLAVHHASSGLVSQGLHGSGAHRNLWFVRSIRFLSFDRFGVLFGFGFLFHSSSLLFHLFREVANLFLNAFSKIKPLKPTDLDVLTQLGNGVHYRIVHGLGSVHNIVLLQKGLFLNKFSHSPRSNLVPDVLRFGLEILHTLDNFGLSRDHFGVRIVGGNILNIR
mmetsp:Transcript_21549/g.38210  ORF Transcript_21549/g.38210 Transcript_21549/m.38210 type:complete len:206 (-) Transcript_21549:538-1155(-)